MGMFIVISSYLLGSIPFGYIVAEKVKGIDIRRYGSGNIGATNVARIVGKKWGFLVFFLDFLKGFLPLILSKNFIPTLSQWWYLFIALASVVGHSWSLYLKFRGGKGVATSLGVMVGLSFVFVKVWLCVLIGVVTWGVVFYFSGYVSLASILSSVGFLLLAFILDIALPVRILAVLLFILILVRHRTNIKNLLMKKELKV